MPAPRLELALERITSGDWAVFERFAAEFLAVEFPSLRTMAAPQGDKGRDGQLYVPEEDPSVAVQYSVAVDWAAKINATVRRLADTVPDVRELIYATNQTIGPAADTLVTTLRRKKRIALDIRDRSWFVEREGTAPQRAVASEELARRLVDPLLAERGLRDQVGVALSDQESRVALLHLALETQDTATDKGLTKASFETLVLAALHDTHSESRLGLPAILSRVEASLPAGYEAQVKSLVESALGRLSGKGGRVKRHNATDDYCLSYEEVQRVQERTADFLIEEQALEDELVSAVRAAGALDGVDEEGLAAAARDLRVAIETVLLRRGEAFAAATSTGVMSVLDASELLRVVAATGRSSANKLTDEQAAFAVFEVLDRPSASVQSHLRRLADGYTLMAFLRQTPDVQKVILRMFSEGDIWLDTSVVLPLLAETLLENPTDRHYTNLMRAAVDAGLRLFVTEGVAEEIERHLNRCATYARGAQDGWRGSVPFVYSAYALAGHPAGTIGSWLEQFRGPARPIQDVMDYLKDVFSIDGRSLLSYSDGAETALRGAVEELWFEAHERRRTRGADLDSFTMSRLVAHDVENTVGVMEIRRESAGAPLGYRAWWLTLDKTAYRLDAHLKDRLGMGAPRSPVLSPDFLVQLLRLGPLRSAINRERRADLAVITDLSRSNLVSKDLLAMADKVRAESSGVEERLVQRRVRDALDELRAKHGPEALAGARNAEERVLQKLEWQGGATHCP